MAIKNKMQDMVREERKKLGLTTKQSETEQQGVKDLLKAK